MSIGDFIQKRRKALGLSADDLAVKIGKNRATIYRYESSYIEKLPSDVLVPLAEALHITPGDLIMKDASPAASDLLPLTADEESLLSKYRRLDDRRQYAVQGYTDSKLEEQERETGELYEEHIKEA